MVLLESNQDAGLIFRVCRRQVIVAPMGGIVDIDIATVIQVMNMYGIIDQKTCLEKVRQLFGIQQKRTKNKNGQD